MITGTQRNKSTLKKVYAQMGNFMWKGISLPRGHSFVYAFVFNRAVKHRNYGTGSRIPSFPPYTPSTGMVRLLSNKKSNCGLKKG